MSIYLIEGPPGSGKTAMAARLIARALAKGTPVATNVELREDFPAFVAKHTAGVSSKRRARRAASVAGLVHVTRDLDELFSIRLAGRGEERGIMVLDELGSLLNSRAWSKQGRDAAIEWFAQHRKLGWRVYVIAQDGDMLDKQLRLMVEQTIRLRNLRGFKRWGIPVIPLRIFVALWTWEATGGRFVTKREVFRLGWWKDLYDTHQIVAGDLADLDAAAIVLPRPASSPDDAPGEDPTLSDGPEGRPAAGSLDDGQAGELDELGERIGRAERAAPTSPRPARAPFPPPPRRLHADAGRSPKPVHGATQGGR